MLSIYKIFENDSKELTIYCDMDGVLTDFDEAVKNIRNDIFKLQQKEFWNEISKAGSDLWANMNWRDDGKKLWKYITNNYNKVIILSSLPGLSEDDITRKNARQGKTEWIRQNLGEEYAKKALLVTDNKDKYADLSSVLIDDKKENIDRWSNDGIGILHKSADETIQKLEEFNN